MAADGSLKPMSVDSYERHLVTDTVVDPSAAAPRDQFEAFARAVRDILSQRWIDTEDETRLLAILPATVEQSALDGWCPIMTVGLDDDEQGILAHRDTEALRRIALFDAIINNADRKGGHLLPDANGHIYAIDHGVSFHVDDKLRTLLWGFAGRPLNEPEATELKRIQADAALADRLTTLLSEPETVAFHARIEALLAAGRFPGPEGRRRPIPWPLV